MCWLFSTIFGSFHPLLLKYALFRSLLLPSTPFVHILDYRIVSHKPPLLWLVFIHLCSFHSLVYKVSINFLDHCFFLPIQIYCWACLTRIHLSSICLSISHLSIIYLSVHPSSIIFYLPIYCYRSLSAYICSCIDMYISNLYREILIYVSPCKISGINKTRRVKWRHTAKVWHHTWSGLY
jgi:hypothetical protein